MLQKYVSLRKCFLKIDIEEIENYLLSRKEDQMIAELLKTLKEMDKVTLRFQSDDTAISQGRTISDRVIE